MTHLQYYSMDILRRSHIQGEGRTFSILVYEIVFQFDSIIRRCGNGHASGNAHTFCNFKSNIWSS